MGEVSHGQRPLTGSCRLWRELLKSNFYPSLESHFVFATLQNCPPLEETCNELLCSKWLSLHFWTLSVVWHRPTGLLQMKERLKAKPRTSFDRTPSLSKNLLLWTLKQRTQSLERRRQRKRRWWYQWWWQFCDAWLFLCHVWMRNLYRCGQFFGSGGAQLWICDSSSKW